MPTLKCDILYEFIMLHMTYNVRLFFVNQINLGGILVTKITHLILVCSISSERSDLVHMLMTP